MVISLDNEISQFEPFGRNVISSVPEHRNRQANNNEHDDLLTLAHHLHNDFTAAELDNTRDLFRSLNDVSISKEDSYVQREFWRVRRCAKGEEELYVNENTVICSYKQSNNCATSFLDKTYTFCEKIIDANWCNFITNDNINGIASQELSNVMYKTPTAETASSNQYPKFLLSPSIAEDSNSQSRFKNESNFYKNLSLARSLCVLDKYSIHIVSENGDHHRKSLQFEVSKMVPNNFGLLLERVVNDNEKMDKTLPPYPLIFTLSNPLNEILPVLLVSNSSSKQSQSSGQNIGYITRMNDLSLIEFIPSKNFSVFYSSATSSHHIYYLRPVNSVELDWIRQDLQRSDDEIPMEIDRLNHSDMDSNLNLVSTPIANGDANKKQCRLSYQSNASSPITRSMSNTLYANLVQSSVLHSRNSSSPRGTNSIANVSSPHSGRQSLSNMPDHSAKRVFSPSTKLSALISSRLDSPVSPSLNRLTYSTSNARLLDTDSEMRLPLSFNTSGKTVKNSNAATPTVVRSNDLFVQKFSEPVIAEFTLEFLWCEPKSSSQGSHNVAASKVFVTSDFLGQNYLCLLIEEAKDLMQSFNSTVLKLIKFDAVSDDTDPSPNKTHYIFGTTTKLANIKDAEPLDSLNMIIVLDDTNSLVLYSGVHKVSIVHLQSSSRLSTGLSENLDCNKTMSPNFKKILNKGHESPGLDFDCSDFLLPDHLANLKSNKIQASSPLVTNVAKSDSLNLSSCTLMNKPLDESLLTFSIQQYPSFGKIVTIRDSVDSRVTFETTDSKYYRLSFPQMASTFLVDKCLAALRQTFSKEIAIQFLTSWYTFRNSTNKDENIPEIYLFKLCLLSMIGYDKDSIKEDYICRNEIATNTVLSSGNAKSVVVSSPLYIGHSESLEKEITKKMKIEDDFGSEEDWCSFVHNSTNLYGMNKAQMLEAVSIGKSKQPSSTPKTKHAKRSKKKSPVPVESTLAAPVLKSQFAFNSPEFLFPHTSTILNTLHLVYEDLKLVQMNWLLCKSLVDILYLLAVDLKLPKYQDHYIRDFPLVCAEISTHERYNGFQNKLSQMKGMENESPPSIFSTLFSLLKVPSKGATQSPEFNFPYIGSGGCVSKSISTMGAHIITPNIFNLIVLYSNLNQDELIEPQQVLKCIGNNLFLNYSSASSYINVHKFKQIVKLYSASSRSLDDTLLNSSAKLSRSKNTLLNDITQSDRSKSRQSICGVVGKRDSREKILFLMSALGVTQDYIKELPFGLALPLWDIIYNYRVNPKNDWCSSIYSLIDRPDLLSLECQEHISQDITQTMANDDEAGHVADDDESELAFLDHSVLRLLFPDDQRLYEAYRMLISSKPALVNIQQAHGTSDHDFVEEQEKYLYALCIRTMALPLGRGMVTLRSHTPVVAERLPIPPLCLVGKVPPRNTVVELTHIDVPPNMNIWPLFHNGVSAGLRISSNLNKMVDSSWILFNKPANNTTSEEHYGHAGFLLALGLNGLLDNLSIMDLHEYLSKGNDLTKVAILLGLAASKRGTMDSNAYILLGIHLEGLLPSTSTELDVSPIVKVASVLGVGLLFQGTGHSYIAEVMLNEIGRPPGPEMEHYIDRESYALSAGLAFGLVTLGRGNEMISMVSSEGISIPDQLNHYMLGVHKKLSTLQKEKNKTPSYHIREGDCINADVTSPGATLALGMMFFNTSNQAVAQWLNVPDTQNLLEMVRPDFILLRVLARNLIMWSDIKPTSEWIELHIPPIIFQNSFQKVEKDNHRRNENMFQEDIDYETMTQSHCNIVAGACFALALRYAGSADKEAFAVVKKYTIKLITLIQKGSTPHIEQAGRSTIESCVNVMIIACSIIMAGTGDVEVMRLCRYLRSRINQCHVLYGSFMAIHMAMGLLFLGGCRFTLNSSPESVAALICAFFPKYPIHTYDNRYHLQAFRHLYVLATEPRMLIPRCIDTGAPVYAKIQYILRDSMGKPSKPVEKLAPCILPDLSLLKSVELVDNYYWNISFECGTNFNKLRKCLMFNGNLYIKRKVKCLTYNKEFIYNIPDIADNGDSLAKSLFQKIDRKSFTLFDFTNEVILKTFSDIFISNNLTNERDLEMKNRLRSILYDCAEDETLELFAPLIKLIASCSMLLDKKHKSRQTSLSTGNIAVMNSLDEVPTAARFDVELGQQCYQKYFTIWQIKFASLFIDQLGKKLPKFKYLETIRFQLEQMIKNSLDKNELRSYLYGHLPLSQSSEALIDAAVFYDIPAISMPQQKEVQFLNLLNILRSNCTSVSTSSALFIYKLLKD